MKRMACVSILGLLLTGLVLTQSAAAQSSNGKYRFWTLEDLPKFVDYDAKGDGERASGVMTFTDDEKKIERDVDGTGERGDPGGPFSMLVSFETMQVEKNRAIINGVIRDSSHPSYVGRFVQLSVEDNGPNRENSDQVMWRVCKPEPGGWIPQDSEIKDDDGAYRSWWATDLERRDDVGIPSKNLIPGLATTCPKYLISTYSYATVTAGDGEIVVTP